ncbi:MAG: hypothetical protein BKP49_02530 [Treponema sp. CETP13]|nr:MAG: hypothetical protein BKP49_02530 [Treponema sp. CETP13]
MPNLWTFENAEKLKPFMDILIGNDIPYEILTKKGEVNKESGLIVFVEDHYYKRAKKELLRYRKRISNRHNR